MRIALYQPDIPQNLGSVIRTSACFGLPVDIIEPCGFPLDPKRIKRVAMDYIDHTEIEKHPSFSAFKQTRQEKFKSSRIILFTTKSSLAYYDFSFNADDILLFGRETSGVPDEVADYADFKVTIPICASVRSLNLAVAVAVAASEAIRQTR